MLFNQIENELFKRYKSLIGNSVKNGNGPAAVIGDERRKIPLC